LFKFLNHIFKSETSSEIHSCYGERVLIRQDEINVLRDNHDNDKINLAEIDYITIYRFEAGDGYGRCLVNLRSYSIVPLSVSTLAENFDALEKLITRLPCFDLQQYLTIKTSVLEIKETVLWQKICQADFAIASDGASVLEGLAPKEGSLALLQHGLLIENKSVLIDWGTYDDLANNSLVKVQSKSFPNPSCFAKEYLIQKPVIFNGLILHSLYTASDSTQSEHKLHLPVIEYRSEISLGHNRQKSFERIKNHLDCYFHKNDVDEIDYAEKDTWRAGWHSGAVRVELYCFYREVPDGWDNLAWLKIHYVPNLDRFYGNDYQRNFALSRAITYQLFEFGMELNTDYRQVENAIYTPDCFKAMLDEAHPLVIWYDAQLGIVGFADKKYALVFNENEMERLTLSVQNFRGSEGRNELNVNIKQASVCIGSVSSVALFKKNIKKISRLTGLDVASYVYNEHY
jgi:hypothetical protein